MASKPVEEQGFNEKELEDIMSEIENLEAEFDDGAAPDASPEEKEGPAQVEAAAGPVEAPKPVAAKPRPSVVKDEPVAPAPVKHSPKPVPSPSPAAEGGPVSSFVDFHVQGDMHVNFKFHFGESWVMVTAGAEDGLVIEMPGGMRFTVPVHPSKSRKAS